MTALASESVDAARMGQELGQHICHVDIVVRAWTGRICCSASAGLPVSVQTTGQAGSLVEISDKVTSPRLILDDLDIFDRLRRNKADIQAVIERFTCSSAQRGMHLLSVLMTGSLSLELDRLRNTRLLLADEAADSWDTVVVPHIQQKFTEYFGSIISKLPAKESLRERFDVSWEFHPLNPIQGEELDLRNLSSAERQVVISRTNQFAEQRAREAFNNVIDQVFGEMVETCNMILAGGLDTGSKQQSSLTNILTQMDKVLNFAHLADAAVVQRVQDAREMLAGVKIQDVNADRNHIRDAIKAAMAPLKSAVAGVIAVKRIGGARADRDVIL